MSKVKICVMVGPPASGKSFRAKYLIDSGEYDIIISSDTIRKELFGSESDQTHNDIVFKTFYSRLKDAIKNNQNVILDATNCTYKARKRVFDEINSIKPKVDTEVCAWVMNTKAEVLFDRDKTRDRTVGDCVIYKFIASYQHPQYFEGFDNIIFDSFNDFDEDSYNNIILKMRYFQQDNPHHIYTLGDHCARVSLNYLNNNVMWWTAILHDVGKLYTKKYDERGVAHYYNHDNVGAYYIATHTELVNLKSRELNTLLFFVNNHMRAHNDYCGEKARIKYRKFFGDDLFDELMWLAEYDRRANGTYEGYIAK